MMGDIEKNTFIGFFLEKNAALVTGSFFECFLKEHLRQRA
jgi:hypothetical protein